MSQKEKYLIVNADDFNLTCGVSEAILRAFDHGIVTSTTLLINLPMPKRILRQLKSRRGLGVGVHLNVTLGKPVSEPQKTASLVEDDGTFKKRLEQLEDLPKAVDLFLEWENQVKHFRKIIGRDPTHFDTHHQLHDHPLFFDVLKDLALKYKVPIRRSKLMRGEKTNSVGSTDYFFGRLKPAEFWKKTQLMKCLSTLPDGLSEIMCHPGYVDQSLYDISSFCLGREAERKLFSSKDIRGWVLKKGIRLINFGRAIISQ